MKKKATLLFVFSIIVTFVASAQIGLVRRDSSFAPLTLEIENASGAYDVIDWGQPTDYGPDWSTVLEAEMTWINDTGGDSLGCVPTAKDLTGKWAVIRRGACGFSLKAFHATDAGAVGYLIVNDGRPGAENAVFNMLGGDSISRVLIPGGFVPRGFGETFTDRLDAGVVTKARMAPISIWEGSVYHYPYVPLGQIETPFLNPQANYYNYETVDSIFTGTLTVTNPDGSVETLGTVLDTILPGTQELMLFSDVEILPSLGVGEYVYTFSSSLPSANDFSTSVFVTEDYWSATQGDIPSRALTLSEAGYGDGGNTMGWGMTIEVAEDTKLGSVQFGICNAEELTTAGNAEVYVEVVIVDLDMDGDGVIDNPGASSVDDFSNDATIGFAEYFLTGSEVCTTSESDLITLAPLNDDEEAPILQVDGKYLAIVIVGSLSPGTIIPPAAQAGVGTNSTTWFTGERLFSKIFQTDNFFSGFIGFSDDAEITNGYQVTTPTFRMSTSEISSTRQLLGGQLILAPNPATEVSQLRYSLQDEPKNGIVEVFSLTGQKVYSQLLLGDRAGSMDIPVDALATGMYTVRISTEAGERSLPLQVVR
ncbi:MAG: PA domain-containing protein [Saprospiraceae bacterium]